MSDMRKEWYVLQALTGQEQKAQRQIVSQARSAGLCDYFDIPEETEKGEVFNDFNVVVPTEKVVEVKDGKKRLITRKLCPGYVLVRMALYEDAAHRHIHQDLFQFIMAIPGITRFVGTSQKSAKPLPITDAEAADLLNRVEAEAEKPKLKVVFQVGETIRITEGPFMNFNGVVDQIDPDSGKLQVSVSIFGRTAPVTLEYWQAERFIDNPEGM